MGLAESACGSLGYVLRPLNTPFRFLPIALGDPNKHPLSFTCLAGRVYKMALVYTRSASIARK